MAEPAWSDNRYPPIDYQGISYYSAPKVAEKKKSLDEVRQRGTATAAPSLQWQGADEASRSAAAGGMLPAGVACSSVGAHHVRRIPLQGRGAFDVCTCDVMPWIPPSSPRTAQVDPELLATFDKLGIPLNEQKRLANVAVDAVFDSVSIATTFKEELAKASAAARGRLLVWGRAKRAGVRVRDGHLSTLALASSQRRAGSQGAAAECYGASTGQMLGELCTCWRGGWSRQGLRRQGGWGKEGAAFPGTSHCLGPPRGAPFAVAACVSTWRPAVLLCPFRRRASSSAALARPSRSTQTLSASTSAPW